ncbi:MAG: class I SAM-dependent methyltransferase [Pseudoxanthomonas sp.]|nr:class I SAM-dependent methyltransferase [Pseudoxanthomonas sp.]
MPGILPDTPDGTGPKPAEPGTGGPAGPEGCPLCHAPGGTFARVDGLDYARCTRCQLTYLSYRQRPAPAREREEYLLHRNHPDDPGYRKFLERLATPLRSRLRPGSQVLDFGCGPGPALAAMLRDSGHEVAVYDPWFAPYPAVLARNYDAVTCTEVVEHLHDPAAVLTRLRTLVRAGGLLAVMTSLLEDGIDFARWHYRRDCTHVAFWRMQTFDWLARSWGWRAEPVVPGVVFLLAPPATA